AEILDHDVGNSDQPLDDLQAFGAAHIQAEALLVDVCVIEISGGVEIDLDILRRGGARQPAALILWPLDLDDLRPKGPEPARRPRPGTHPAEIHDADVFKGARTRHGIVLLPRPSPSACPGRYGQSGTSAGRRARTVCSRTCIRRGRACPPPPGRARGPARRP